MDDDYKRAKEAFVSDTTGSSMGHINAITFAAISTLALYQAVRTRLAQPRWVNGLVPQVALLVLPLLFSITTFAFSPGTLNTIIVAPAMLLVLLPARDHTASPLPSHEPALDLDAEKKKVAPISSVQPLAALSTWRAHMMLMTALCILAVDFPVYPRELAKCETFGTGLMDMGVGSFVFAQGLMSASPLLRSPSFIHAPLVPKLVRSVTKVVPMFALAAARIIAVKGTAYPEHVSEYGAHWNFFLTLALLPPMQVVLHPLLAYVSPTILGVIVTIIHQLVLSGTHLQEWALNAPRTSLITANREGLASLPGYLALHLLGLGLGLIVLAPSPSYFRRVVAGKEAGLRRRDDGRLAMELGGWAVVWWTALGLALFFTAKTGGVSRRLANLPYVLWCAAYNVAFLFGYLALDRVFAPPAPKKRSHHKPSTPASSAVVPVTAVAEAPPLLEAINKNGLTLFLLANVLTGTVNLSMRTMDASDSTALVVLSGYMFAFCGAAWRFRHRKLW